VSYKNYCAADDGAAGGVTVGVFKLGLLEIGETVCGNVARLRAAGSVGK
jgi:hypothetical protein